MPSRPRSSRRQRRPIDHIVASYARALPLHPGDVVLTGSPGGVGVALDRPRRLEPGDHVVVSSRQLGGYSVGWLCVADFVDCSASAWA